MKYSDQFTAGDGRSRVFEILRGVLLSRARSGKTITYPQLGERMGRPPQGPWPELDVISEEELAAGRPDLSLVVVDARTNFPARFLGRVFNARDPEEVADFNARLAQVYEHYRPVKAAPIRKAELQ